MKIEPSNPDIDTFRIRLEEEIALDNRLKPDDPERQRFERLLQWMEQGGAKF